MYYLKANAGCGVKYVRLSLYARKSLARNPGYLQIKFKFEQLQKQDTQNTDM